MKKHVYAFEKKFGKNIHVRKFFNFLQAGKIKNKKTKLNTFFFNPQNKKKKFDVYIDKNPKDTIHIKYTTIQDVKNTINKLERLYKSNHYPHKRIWQVGMIMKVRLAAIKKHHHTRFPNAKNVNTRYNLAEKYLNFLKKRTAMQEIDRKKAKFSIS